MKVSVVLELSDSDWAELSSIAVINGFWRDEPEKSWTEKEKKASIRVAVAALVKEELHRRRGV